MGVQRGILKFTGLIGDLIFYRSGSRDLVRHKGSLDRERIYRDPAFERTRENMQEFGMCSKAGKALRMGLGGVMKGFADGSCVQRLVGVMRGISALGTGQRGQRTLDVVAYGDRLAGFELNANVLLGSVFTARYSVTANTERNMATVVVPGFDAGAHVAGPSGATHFRVVCGVATLCNYVYDGVDGGYVAVVPGLNGQGGVGVSGVVVLDGEVVPDIVLHPSLPGAPVLGGGVVLVVCVGVQFVQFINGGFYALGQGNAMRVVKVF